jgi:hypothetical protein
MTSNPPPDDELDVRAANATARAHNALDALLATRLPVPADARDWIADTEEQLAELAAVARLRDDTTRADALSARADALRAILDPSDESGQDPT